MDESYGTYVDDEYFDNHEYDDTDDDTDDDNDHKKDSYTAAGAAPDAGAALVLGRIWPGRQEKLWKQRGLRTFSGGRVAVDSIVYSLRVGVWTLGGG